MKRYIDIEVPYIPVEIEKQIEYLKEIYPEGADIYKVIDNMVTFQYRDESLDWIYKSDDNMNSFALAWILDEWVTFR